MELKKSLQITFDTEEIADLAYLAQMGKARIDDNNKQSTPDQQERRSVSIADRIMNAHKYLMEGK